MKKVIFVQRASIVCIHTCPTLMILSHTILQRFNDHLRINFLMTTRIVLHQCNHALQLNLNYTTGFYEYYAKCLEAFIKENKEYQNYSNYVTMCTSKLFSNTTHRYKYIFSTFQMRHNNNYDLSLFVYY